MQIKGWRYYNHAAIPTTAPHEKADLTPVKDGSIWKMNGNPLFVRWTDQWDCDQETEWWYVIIDKPFDIETLNAKDRKKIRTGLKNFKYVRINPAEFAEQMAYVTQKDWESYPKKYRPKKTKEELVESYKNWKYLTWGAFDIDNLLCAFNGIEDCGSYYRMVQRKSIPEKQKGQLNAGLIYTNITDLSHDIKRGKYISNGQRNLNHETNFNEDLCKYYGFRKAYCKLNVKYSPKIRWAVKLMYMMRALLKKHDNIPLLHELNVVIQMECICRNES